MKSCSTASDFRQIAFERNNDSDPDTAAHWTLPHHPRPGAGPDAAGVAAALAALHGGRGGPPDLKASAATVESHLQGHQAETSSVEGRGEQAHTIDQDRLTWSLETSRYLSVEADELARTQARIERL
jgi:hypothetical protein